ncbi:MAG: HYR domain-containing protein [Usitatibacter sp.]
MRTSRVRPTVASLVGSLLIACSAFAQPYKLIDLGPITPDAVNDSDVVVGALRDPSSPPSAGVPFIWRDGVLMRIDVPGAWNWGFLASVNSSGTAVGSMTRGDPPMELQTPFIYRDGIVTFIPLSGDFTSGSAFAINDSGTVVGFMSGIGTGSASFLYKDGVTTLLPAGCSVWDISSTGVAVGAGSDPASGFARACVWENSAIRFLPGGPYSSATRISNSGVILGYATPDPALAPHVVVWENDIMRDLGGVPGALFTSGSDINDSGMIVGFANFEPAPTGGAFLYRDNAFEMLDALMGASTGWHFDFAVALNQRGDIVGLGHPPGASEWHGYLLVAQKTVADTTPPVLVVPANIAVDATSPSGAVVSYVVTASDAVDPHPVVHCVPASGSTFAAGTTTVTCTATDASGNSATASFSVTVFGASEQIADLIDLVNSFNLRRGIEITLDAELRIALHATGAGRVNTACIMLGAFIIEVRALSGKGITTAQANQLIAAANQARAALPCG